ncbi:MAG: hypothetical protein GXY64_10910 [Bacteroidales bacterium]|nr:hypothetical protein [Bacteroidales bacterium]
MKKYFILALALTAWMLIGCKGGEQKGETQGDSTQVEGGLMYESADWAFYALKGKVKEVSSIRYMVDEDFDVEQSMYDLKDTVRFTPDGEMTIYKDRDADLTDPMFNNALTRNEQGQVVKYDFTLVQSEDQFDDRCMMWDGTDLLTFDNRGRVIKRDYVSYEVSGVVEYTYDAQGLCPTSKGHFTSEGQDIFETYTYEYISFDDKGNWIERKQTTEGSNKEYGEENLEEYKEYMVEKRTIIYY